MENQLLPEFIGKTILFNEFAFQNKAGGTGLSNWKYNEQISGEFEAEVTKCWNDYETGVKFIAKPKSPELIEYLKRNASKDEVYVSEFQLVKTNFIHFLLLKVKSEKQL